MKLKKAPTQEELKKRVLYCKHTGNFVWKDYGDNQRRNSPGSSAGSLGKTGYKIIVFKYENYFAHRLAWIYSYGYNPEGDIDHIDGNRSNNTLSNLREVSRSCNLLNTDNSRNNTSGVKGVSWSKDKNMWRAYITLCKKQKFLGRYKEFANAVCARHAAEYCAGASICKNDSPAFRWINNNITHN